ncbi:MAG: ATP-binding protein [Spirulina sp. DLM2.Bin59]|nr:MAG: ATP-binding protein [Spirulina sp. DLM2.Bin59]
MGEALQVVGVLESLEAIAQYVKGAAKAAQLDPAQAYNLRLAVDEIATNIITHGYEDAGLTGEIVLWATCTPETLTIHLEDEGKAYNPHAWQAEVTPELCQQPPEQRPLGGLGVYLAMRSVDQFRYERVGDRNHTEFVIFRNPS